MIILCTALPLAILAWFAERSYRESSGDASIAEAILMRMQAGEREICEENPERWAARRGNLRRRGAQGRREKARRPGQGRRDFRGSREAMGARGMRAGGMRVRFPAVAYGSDFMSTSRGAPTFPAALREGLEGGDDVAAVTEPHRQGHHRVLAVRMPWQEGPCAIITVARPSHRGVRQSMIGLAAPVGVALIAALISLFAISPLVRRIRSLVRQVHTSSQVAAGEPWVPFDVGGGDELSELAAVLESNRGEIQDKLKALQKRDRALRDYVANTTHDLMVPLAVLQGHLASMRAAFVNDPSLDRKPLAAALEESHYLGSLVHNLNVAAKLEAGGAQLSFGKVDLGQLVERVVGRHAPIAKEKEVMLDFAVPAEPLCTDGDMTLLEQAVSNLVHNAIRYNHAGGHVAVTLELESDDTFSLNVVDDGPGVSPADLARLVERRFRGSEARSRTIGGNGLGLAISLDVAKRHGLTLALTLEEPTGLRASLRGATRAELA